MKTIGTERLILRAWRDDESDAADMFAYAKSANVGPNAGWVPHDSVETARKTIRRFIEQDDVWAITDRATNRVIGSIALHPDPKRENERARMLGYVLREESWGQGLMPEAVGAALEYAFGEMGLELVSVYHFQWNIRSKRVIEKNGFVYEGTLRNAEKLPSGRVCDHVCYSITAEEYAQR